MTSFPKMAEERSAMMLGEALHRFSNSLQVIMSATNGILRDIRDVHARDRLQSLQQRIALLAEINRSLSGPFGPDAVSALALERLCAGLAAASDRVDARVFVDVEGDVPLPYSRRTLLLLLAELMTNALKHGSPCRSLEVRVRMTTTLRCCTLTVHSNTLPAGRARTGPRIATELVEAGDGLIRASGDANGYRVIAELPFSRSDLLP